LTNIMWGWPVFGHGSAQVPCSQCSLHTTVNRRNVRNNFQGCGCSGWVLLCFRQCVFL